MDAGKLDRRVLIEAKTETQSPLGDLDVSWQPVATVWARKLSSKGREFFAGALTLGTQEVGIQIRHTPTVAGLDQTARFTLEGKVYNVKSIDEVGRKEYQTIIGTFGANDG